MNVILNAIKITPVFSFRKQVLVRFLYNIVSYSFFTRIIKI